MCFQYSKYRKIYLKGKKVKKIIFGITSLTLGGAERVLVDLANKMSERFDITIFMLYSNGELETELNKKIKLKTLYSKKYTELTFLEKILASLKVLINKKIGRAHV